MNVATKKVEVIDQTKGYVDPSNARSGKIEQ